MKFTQKQNQKLLLIANYFLIKHIWDIYIILINFQRLENGKYLLNSFPMTDTILLFDRMRFDYMVVDSD